VLSPFDYERNSISVADCRQPKMPLVYVNAGFERFCGYSRDEVLGKNCRFLQGPKTSPASIEIMRDAIRRGTDCLVEIVNYHRDGRPFLNRLSLRPVLTRRGAPAFYIGLQSEVSHLRQLEDKLIEHLHQFC
jgi:PAS domain S-box-containing protein